MDKMIYPHLKITWWTIGDWSFNINYINQIHKDEYGTIYIDFQNESIGRHYRPTLSGYADAEKLLEFIQKGLSVNV